MTMVGWRRQYKTTINQNPGLQIWNGGTSTACLCPSICCRGGGGGADDDNNLTPLSALTSHLRLLQQSPLRSSHDNNNDTIVSSDYEKRGLRMMRLQ